jgi:hypothetical protein
MTSLETALLQLRTNAEVSITILPSAVSLSGAVRLANRVKGSTTLRTLCMNSCQLQDQHAELLAEAIKHSLLRAVFFGHNSIGTLGACAILHASVASATLQSLALYGNRIGDNGAREIAKLLPALRLESLDLGKNDIGDEGAFALARGLVSSRIKDISFAANLVTDRGGIAFAESLKGNPRIERLDLSDNTEISEVTVMAMRSAIRAHRSIRIISLAPGTMVTAPILDMNIEPIIRMLHSQRARLMTVLCSPSSIERIGRRSPLRHMHADILRLMCRALIFDDHM